MYEINYNFVMKSMLEARPEHELSDYHVLQVCVDFNEGVEYEYLATRLYLLNVAVSEDRLRQLIWVLIAQGRLELTVNRKLKFIKL